MASFSGGGGGFGGPRGLPQGVTQAQLDEIKSFNAGLTQAGNKSRPPRSRGSGLNRGLGSGISPGRGGSYSASSTLALAAVLDMVVEHLTALDQALHCQLQSQLLEKQLQLIFEAASMSPRPDGPIWTTVELVLWVAILSAP